MKNLESIIKKVLKEESEKHSSRYMFFSNLEQMKRQCEMLLDMDQSEIESILENGHDWAQDHIAEAKNNMDQVFDFLKNETEGEGDYEEDEDMIEEGRKKKRNVATNKKLWQQSLAWARQRYEVCPSAYCNGAAVKRYNSKGGKWKKG
jgi:septation ring formation regulator EzrA